MSMLHKLTPAQLQEMRTELESMRKILERRIQRTTATAQPVELDQTAVGRLSRMDALQNQDLAAGAHARVQVELARVLDALARLDGGAYGLCHTCSRPIAYERLSVMPEARDCQTCSRQA